MNKKNLSDFRKVPNDNLCHKNNQNLDFNNLNDDTNIESDDEMELVLENEDDDTISLNSEESVSFLSTQDSNDQVVPSWPSA